MIPSIIIIFNLLVYGAAFYVSHKTGQSMTIYFVYLAVQVLFLIWYFWEKSTPSHSDAAGSGMAAGFLVLIAAALQVGMALLALLTFGVRQISGNGGIAACIIALIVGMAYFFLFTDFRCTFLTLTSGTNEQKLVQKDSIMYNRNGKLFSGTSYLKGIFETSVAENGDGVRVTQYKDGLKNGTEKIYYTTYIISLGNRTQWNAITVTHYRNGLKHGTETTYYYSGSIATEANYANGKLDGLYREYYYPEHGNPPQIETEVQYANGEVNGYYHTYKKEDCETGAYEEDYADDNYTAENGRIIDGRRWIIRHDNPKVPFVLEYYSNGKMILQSFYEHRNSYYPSEGCISTTTYDNNGEIDMYYEFDSDNGNVILCKKNVKGKLIEIFNKETGLDRCEEFGVDNNFYVI